MQRGGGLGLDHSESHLVLYWDAATLCHVMHEQRAHIRPRRRHSRCGILSAKRAFPFTRSSAQEGTDVYTTDTTEKQITKENRLHSTGNSTQARWWPKGQKIQKRGHTCIYVWASQASLAVKYPPAKAGDTRDANSIPGLRRSPGGRHGNSLQCPENPKQRGTWRATIGSQRVGHDRSNLACNMSMYRWFTLLYSRNWHSTVKQLYSNNFYFLKKHALQFVHLSNKGEK